MRGMPNSQAGNSAGGPDQALPKDWQQALVHEAKTDIYKLGAWG